MMEYFPEHMAISCRGGFRAAFRLFSGAPVRYVSKDGQPLVYPTEGEAKAAARECLARVLNPPIRAEKIEPPAPDPLESEYKEFLTRREQEAAEERARVFGSAAPTKFYPGKGRAPVVVETRRRRVA
jgi:hypothetical protein